MTKNPQTSPRVILGSLFGDTGFARMLREMNPALEQRRDKTRALKQGMMQELLTGRTRLV
jgi:type I restriction enzyme S subunit